MRKRILILIKGLARGGAEQLLASAAPYLDASRFDYEVAYVLPHLDQLVGELRGAGLRVTCLGGASGYGWMWRLRRLVREHRIDLVHSHGPYTGTGARLALPGIRSVYTEHSVWPSYRVATRWANMLTLSRVDHVFAVSEHVRQSMGPPSFGPFPVRMPSVETLYHGIDPAAIPRWRPDGVRTELGIRETAPLVVTVANLRAEKGLDVLLVAADLVRQKVPNVRFVIVGHGLLEAQLREHARRLHLDQTVLLTGYRADAPRIAAASDVFALSSIYEGLSIALIEALALGRPAVVTDAGGLPEIVRHGEEGLVVRRGEPHDLAAGLITLLLDPELRKRFGGRAAKRAASFDIRPAVVHMEEVYGRLLSESPSPSRIAAVRTP
jgi:glycosyltransferase involved in cell wall biosynthesis